MILSTALTVSACVAGQGQGTDTAVPTATIELATPVADSPAAGICAEHTGEFVSITINPDIPDPRCSFVRPEQYLRVVNMRGEMITVTFAQLEADIAPGEEHIFEESFGALLMPGVHRFDVLPCCGAELVLQANP
jgi:hypothetical protein